LRPRSAGICRNRSRDLSKRCEVLTMSVPQPIIPLLQIGDAFNAIAPHNILASLMTGGQYRPRQVVQIQQRAGTPSYGTIKDHPLDPMYFVNMNNPQVGRPIPAVLPTYLNSMTIIMKDPNGRPWAIKMAYDATFRWGFYDANGNAIAKQTLYFLDENLLKGTTRGVDPVVMFDFFKFQQDWLLGKGGNPVVYFTYTQISPPNSPTTMRR